jgi:hypothetical protein
MVNEDSIPIWTPNENWPSILIVTRYIFLLDPEDFIRFARYQWRWGRLRGKIYASRQIYDTDIRQHIYLHREILNAPPECEVDHINGNTFDNRRLNLRLCTHAQNIRNSHKVPGRSGYRGVWPTASGRWQAMIKSDYRRRYLGTFDTPEEAYARYCEKARELWGDFTPEHHYE